MSLLRNISAITLGLHTDIFLHNHSASKSNVSKNALIVYPTFFLSSPICPCNQCPKNKKQKSSSISSNEVTNSVSSKLSSSI